MKYILLIFMSLFCLKSIGQEEERFWRIGVHTGYVLPTTKDSEASLNEGLNIHINADCNLSGNNFWRQGFGANYIRSSFSNIGFPYDISADIYSISWRNSWRAKVYKNLFIWGAIESGPAYMQSRHQYQEKRIRTKRMTVMVGIEVGIDFKLSETIDANISYGIQRFGNDNLQYGSNPSISPSALYIAPSFINFGLSFDINRGFERTPKKH